MTADAAIREQIVLDRLRETYELRGYEFFMHPHPDLLPEFLRGARPDAMAMKGEEKLLIQVITGHPATNTRIRALSDRVRGHPGWSMKVYSSAAPIDEQHVIDPPTGNDIAERIDEVEALLRAGHARAGILLAWSVLEAITRGIGGSRVARATRPLLRDSIALFLEMEGLIDDEEAERLREAAGIGNKVAHGDLDLQPSEDVVRWMLTLARRLSPAAISAA